MLAFQGSLSLNEEILFLATSPEYTYWRVRTYPIYAAHGWLTGEVEIGTSKEFHSSKESELMSQSRQKDTYIINSMFPTKIWPVPSYIVKSKDLFQLSVSPKTHRIMLLPQPEDSSEINTLFNNSLNGIQLDRTGKADIFVFFEEY